MHIVAAHKRLRHERNVLMETAYRAALAPHQKRVPLLKDLLIHEEPAPRRRQTWQEMKAHLMLALGPGKPKDT